jgi:RES domain-containing protein
VSLVVWRIVQRRLASHAFSGDGARRYGGRWNSPGIAVVYTAQSQSLAALEILVHIDSGELLQNYNAIPITVDESLIMRTDASTLPRNWRAYPSTKATRLLGDTWLIEEKTAVLQVPSAVIPTESNFLLNPGHRDFCKLTAGKSIAFKFDSRLARNSRS